VSEHYWLGYPDADWYDELELRNSIIKYIRLVRPDFIFTTDPWLPYDAHRDHICTGLAVSEAVLLYGLKRLSVDPQVDAAYEPHEVEGIVYCFTQAPNTFVDISQHCKKKHQALDICRAQFTEEDMARLHQILDLKEREFTEGRGFSHAEPLKGLQPVQLHAGVDTWRS
jgi:LmbE family N-acetylglucosaminyl deacetylase